jgi:hypothetical protein
MRLRLLSPRRCVCYLFTRLIKAYIITSAFCMPTQSLAFLIISLHVIFFPHLRSSNHKSTQTSPHRCLDGFEDWSPEFQQNPEDDC